MNNNNFGCGAMIAVVLGLLLVLKAIVWIGIPVAVIGLGIAAFLYFKKEDDAKRRATNVRNSIFLSIGAVVVGGIALAADDGQKDASSEIGSGSEEPASAESKPTAAECEIIKQTTPRFASMIKKDCARQLAGRSGESMLINMCVSERVGQLRDCGVDYSLE